MRTSDPFVIISFLLLALPLQAREVTVRAEGIGYAGEVIRVFRQTDPVTATLEPLLRLKGDSSGRFSFAIKAGMHEKIIIKAGIFSIFFYIAGDNEYDLRLPDLVRKSKEEEQDIYFIPLMIMPEVSGRQSDINNLVRSFDIQFDTVYNMVADRVMYNFKRDELPSLIGKLNAHPIQPATEFFSNFVTFRLIMLNMVARGEYPGRIEDSILINRIFLPENPGYTDLVKQMFDHLFRELASGSGKEDFFRAAGKLSLEDLRKVISANTMVSNRELLDYVMLINLYASFYDGTLYPEDILALLSSLSEKGSSRFIKELAVRISEMLNALAPGTFPPGFDLAGSGGKRVTPAMFTGSYLLISFARSDNSFTLSEYGILKRVHEKYESRLQIITVLTDEDFNKAESRMRGFGFSWIFADGSGSDILEFSYRVNFYPSFILIGPDGKVAIKECPFPSENLDAVIGKLLSAGKE